MYTNLALEDWLYKNFDFSNQTLLMLWQSDPCVVIGRHQNPWLEANMPNLQANDMPVARRNSGGGTVYHDNGNLNLTFFTNRDLYNRLGNLEMIVDTLNKEWGIHAEVNSRKDIMWNGHKVCMSKLHTRFNYKPPKFGF